MTESDDPQEEQSIYFRPVLLQIAKGLSILFSLVTLPLYPIMVGHEVCSFYLMIFAVTMLPLFLTSLMDYGMAGDKIRDKELLREIFFVKYKYALTAIFIFDVTLLHLPIVWFLALIGLIALAVIETF